MAQFWCYWLLMSLSSPLLAGWVQHPTMSASLFSPIQELNKNQALKITRALHNATTCCTSLNMSLNHFIVMTIMTQIMADNIQKGMMGWWGCKKGGFGTFVSCHIFFMSMFPGWGVSPCGPSAWWCWWWWPSGSRRQARTGRTLCSEGGSTPGSGRGRPLRWQRQNNPVMILRCFISLLSECSGWWKREKYWRQKCVEVWQHQAEGRGGGQGGQTQQGAPGQPGIIFVYLIGSVRSSRSRKRCR